MTGLGLAAGPDEYQEPHPTSSEAPEQPQRSLRLSTYNNSRMTCWNPDRSTCMCSTSIKRTEDARHCLDRRPASDARPRLAGWNGWHSETGCTHGSDGTDSSRYRGAVVLTTPQAPQCLCRFTNPARFADSARQSERGSEWLVGCLRMPISHKRSVGSLGNFGAGP